VWDTDGAANINLTGLIFEGEDILPPGLTLRRAARSSRIAGQNT